VSATSDPSREPVLARADPADAIPGSTVPEFTTALMELRDGSWIEVAVTGQRFGRSGRRHVGLRWFTGPGTAGREGWFILDRAHLRRPAEEVPTRVRIDLPEGWAPRRLVVAQVEGLGYQLTEHIDLGTGVHWLEVC